ncbi:hypothetical protein BDW62DRAFT_106166 [Aspergillus aurantiobrunneus]
MHSFNCNMVSSDFLSRLFQRAPRRQHQRQSQPPPQLQPPQPSTSAAHGVTEHINTVPYVSRAVLDSPGIRGRSCEVNGDPHDRTRLPILPPGYTSVLAASNRSDNTDNQASQGFSLQDTSPLFTKLPPEVRELIYLHAFGSRRIHLDYDFSPHLNRWTWWHRVCDDDANCPGKEFACPETAAAEATMLQLGSSSWVKSGFEYKLDAVNWLRCCKIGYQECLPILYSSNTLVLSHGIDQVFRLMRVMPPDHLRLITSLSIEIDVYRICTPPAEPMEIEFQQYYQDLFQLLEARLPNLRGLTLSIAGIPSPPRERVEWTDGHALEWIGPLEILFESRRWKRLEFAVPEAWVGVFGELMRQRGIVQREAGFSLVAGVESFRKGW